MTMSPSNRRVASMQSLDCALGEIQSIRGSRRVREARRVFVAVVGAQNAKDCTVLSVRGQSMLVGVRTPEVVKRIDGHLGFVFRMIAERCEGDPITEVTYVVRPHLNATMSPRKVTARPTETRIDSRAQALINDITESIADPELRTSVTQWMTQVWSQDKGQAS